MTSHELTKCSKTVDVPKDIVSESVENVGHLLAILHTKYGSTTTRRDLKANIRRDAIPRLLVPGRQVASQFDFLS